MARIEDGFSDNRFFMLGIIHGDARNDTVVKKWMDDVRPDVITLELSPYGLAFRQEKGRAYMKRIDAICRKLQSEGYSCTSDDLRSFYSYVSVPREFEIARDYCAVNGSDLYLVDMGLFSYMKLKKIDELISEENIRKNLIEDSGGRPNGQKVLAGLYFRSGVSAFQYTDEMALRDRFMSRRITVLMRRFIGKRILHITGWQHLKDPLDLYAPLSPVKIYPYD